MKIIKVNEVGKYIKDGSTVAVEGFIGSGVAEAIHQALGDYFLEHKSPKNLTLIHAAGIGDGKDKGMNHYAHVGMIKRVIGGHWAMAPMLKPLVENNIIEAYNFPQGVISHLFRAASSKQKVYLSKVGLGTFVDPRYQGGKLNQKTTEDLVNVVNLFDEEYLAYNVPSIDVAILRGSFADKDGNISFEDEALTLEAFSMAVSAHNNGGIVIVQVKEIKNQERFQPKSVNIPGFMVDYVVKASSKEHHKQTYATHYNEAFTEGGKLLENLTSDKLDERKLIARYAASYVPSDAKVVNYGIGMPEAVAKVIKTEHPKLESKLTATIEPGTIGGAPLSGLDFGVALYPDAIIDQSYMFDFYDGGGIDIAFLGMAECDKDGNINVSKFGHKIAGAGGFINISQNTKHLVFCGTFTAGNLQVKIDDELKIVNEGKNPKFVEKVEQITFNGKLAFERGQIVHYVTERAIFKLTEKGLCLTSVAKGIDIKRDILEQMEFMPEVARDIKVLGEEYFK